LSDKSSKSSVHGTCKMNYTVSVNGKKLQISLSGNKCREKYSQNSLTLKKKRAQLAVMRPSSNFQGGQLPRCVCVCVFVFFFPHLCVHWCMYALPKPLVSETKFTVLNEFWSEPRSVFDNCDKFNITSLAFSNCTVNLTVFVAEIACLHFTGSLKNNHYNVRFMNDV